MKIFNKKTLSLLPLVALTSCGYSLSYLVEGNKYNSPIFTENYYQSWDSELKNAKKGKEEIDYEHITSFSKLDTIDPYLSVHPYFDAEEYGQDYKMNKIDDSFNYGYQSKLFDGRVVCGGFYQLSRIQTGPEGFSVRFQKEGNNIQYLAMQFKATTDNTLECYKVNSDVIAQSDIELYHNSSINLTVSLYTKNDSNEIINNSYTSVINLDNKRTNNGSAYIFYAIDLKEENLSRLVGISFSYTVDDELINWNKTKGINNITYALFMYEVFLPYTSWN